MTTFDSSSPRSSSPLAPDSGQSNDAAATNAAIQLIRQKVARAYTAEPAAAQEIITANSANNHGQTLSKHQLYMRSLSTSGKSLADIQTAWHQYYAALPDTEKRVVWQEFYTASHTKDNAASLYQAPHNNPSSASPQLLNSSQPQQAQTQTATIITSQATLPQPNPSATQPASTPTNSTPLSTPAANPQSQTALPAKPTIGVMPSPQPAPSQSTGRGHRPPLKPAEIIGTIGAVRPSQQTVKDIRARIRRTVSANGKLTMKHHIQSLLFGFGMGGIVLVVLLFSFFNEMVIAPLIQPSRTVTNQPIIVGSSVGSQSAPPSVIVPKINIQIPVDFTLQSNEEAVIQNALENGVVHYPSTVLPGQNGNGAYFGHSSQNIFNNGKYKFAFVLLHQLKTGDIFYITHNGKVYAYQVFAKEIVPPTQVSVLNDTKGKQATAVLITCDPPGLNTNRLVVWGEQISPSPTGNSAATPKTTTQPPEITDNGPTLWQRTTDLLTFWN